MGVRNFFHFEHHLGELEKDVYPQPQRGDNHYGWAKDVIERWIPNLSVYDVLDVGCGEGFCQEFFEKYNIEYLGTTYSSEDYSYAKDKDRKVIAQDFNFLEANGDRYDLIFARHSLEHSPMPLLTLMEWHRVARKYLILVMPNPGDYGWAGRNHYSVAGIEQIKFWLDRAGWEVTEEWHVDTEFRFLCKKVKRKIPFYED